jgi:serine/threonine protein kinase/WD40 repeat protein
MGESTADRNPFERLAEEFAERLRRGEHPSLTEYIARYPEHADDIRELFPALALVEQHKPDGNVDGIGPATKARPLTRALPDRLGDYRILRYLGEGGMGVVYEAVRESLRSHVALKVMHPQFRHRESYLRRFRTEARSAARLHHTNIVSVFDYGVHDGVCYYAMQYITGHSLDTVLADVRQLRREKAGSALASATLAFAEEDESALVEKSVSGGAGFGAVGSVRETATLGLVTGRYASVSPVAAPADSDTSPPADELTASGEEIAGTGEVQLWAGRLAEAIGTTLGEGVGRSEAHSRRIAEDMRQTQGMSTCDGRLPSQVADPHDPDHTASDQSATALSGHSDDRYYREVARLGSQIAEALAYAHQRSVLHRDIKPPNLILDALGNIWVTDFGLAKFECEGDVSRSHEVVGTLRYMAPERFRGVSTPRCDLYALGATLYEMLTLRPPFEAQNQVELIHRIDNTLPVPPRQLEPRIPRDLETIVLKALAKNPDDRFATATEMRDELRRYLEHRPIRSRPIPFYQRFWRWCERNPKLAAASITAAALTTILAVVSTVAAWTYSKQLEKTQQAERRGRLELGKSLQSEGAALQRTGLAGQRFESLDRLRQAAQVLRADPDGRSRLPGLRNQAIAAMGLVDLRVRREHDCGYVLNHAVDAVLERYSVIERSGEVVVRRLDNDRTLARLPGPDGHDFSSYWQIFSPDGELLMAHYYEANGGDLSRIWNLERQELIGSLRTRNAVFHPDSRRLLFREVEGRSIGIWDRDKRRVVRRLALDFVPYVLALDPEGRRLAVSNHDNTAPRVQILEVETGRVLADWKSQVGNNAMSWSTDGQLLAVTTSAYDRRVSVWNVGRGELSSILQGHTDSVADLLFAHSGYLLATSAWDGTSRLWDAASGESLAMAPGTVQGFSPDDSRMVFWRGGTIGVWDVATAPECRTLHPRILGNRIERRDNSRVIGADISPDGRLVATGDGEGVYLWEADTGRELARLKAFCGEGVLFDPNGESLITAGNWGLYRWPIRVDPDHGPDALRVGPPELLREAETWNRAAWLPDERKIALVDNANAQVLIIDSSHPHPAWSRAMVLDAGENHRMSSVSVSPDGRWLAAGGWYEAGVRVWDLHLRRTERILRPKDAVSITKFFVGFSADGRWLVSCTHPDLEKPSYHFWRVGTWDLGRRIEHERGGNAGQAPAFTADGRLMALGIAPDQVVLADAETGRELARLTTLQPVTPAPLVFSPDGTKLVAATNQRTALIWDLRLIREQLAPMGLDWDAPPYAVARAASDASGPVRPPRPVRVVGEVVEPEVRRTAELAEMNRRLATNPDDAEALIHRGWLRLGMSKAAESIADLERGLRLRPDDVDARYLLAQAYGQANNLPAERACLETYLARSADDSDARGRKGVLEFQLGRLQEAADDLTKVLDADPRRDSTRFRRAEVWHRMGRDQDALADLAPLIERHPQDPRLHRLRSQIDARLSHREQAQPDQ